MSPNENKNSANRDGAEPKAGFATVPIWLVMVFGALFYWAQLFLDNHAGGFSEKVYAPYPSLVALDELQPKSDTDRFRKEGQKLYTANCALCHQPTGKGEAGKAPPLAGSEWVMATGPNRVIRAVLDGVAGPIDVQGQPWNLSMPAWKPVYTDEQIAEILTYIRSEWGNKAPPITTDQVKAIRDQVKDRQAGWSGDELSKIPES